MLLALSSAAHAAGEVRSVPQIVDADTTYVGDANIRFEGVDAPEMDQQCLDANGAAVFCGVLAKQKLEEFSRGRVWTCTISGKDVYRKRDLGNCFADGEDVSRWLVRNGWALAFRRYSTVYVQDEEEARHHKRGLWAGAFIAPWDWRRRDANTVIMGAASVPTDAQRKLISPASSAAPNGCAIKGNIKSRSNCIYHMPGGHFYGRLDMNADPSRRWFCSETEAIAAGCRKSKR